MINFRYCLLLLLVLLGLTSIVSIGTGAVTISPAKVIDALTGTGTSNQIFIIKEYRLPRIVLAILTGAGLAVSGAVLQGIIRNPLASPDVIGITKGAGLAAAIVLFIFPKAPAVVLPLAAFAGAMVVAAVLFFFVYRRDVSPSTLALVGIALGVICQAGIQYLMVKNPIDVNSALIWLTGSLWGRGWKEVIAVLPWLLIFLPITFLLAKKVDILSLGDDVARGLGANVIRLRMILLAVSVALAAGCVAVIGSIGFVGLLCPHLARQLVGASYRKVLPVSALLGAFLVLLADTLSRGVIPPLEIPAGIATSILGAPYFLYLLSKERKRVG
ncbi:FecCD family ABC transporter permease [Brevibacillus sp. SYSU BS000544]|uniref:FecCD family ABC transporter permease n=1 Tax=Brevibacillus sp. SYSU BS000544 TaxID=3416443 RepID=UPI003CE460C7